MEYTHFSHGSPSWYRRSRPGARLPARLGPARRTPTKRVASVWSLHARARAWQREFVRPRAYIKIHERARSASRRNGRPARPLDTRYGGRAALAAAPRRRRAAGAGGSRRCAAD